VCVDMGVCVGVNVCVSECFICVCLCVVQLLGLRACVCECGSVNVRACDIHCTVCPPCIYVFCIYLRTNSDLCHLHHKLIRFYNPDEKCLQRGTDWGFK
jgi:hypothetical protein